MISHKNNVCVCVCVCVYNHFGVHVSLGICVFVLLCLDIYPTKAAKHKKHKLHYKKKKKKKDSVINEHKTKANEPVHKSSNSQLLNQMNKLAFPLMKSWNWEEKCSLLQTLEKITLLHGPPVCLVAVMSDSLWPHGLQPTRLLCSWGFSRWVLGVHWKDWCWSWNSNTLPTWCKEMTHWKRHWCWERLRAGGEGDDRGWDVCLA